MDIRQFQPGDEFAQLKIYNTAAAALTKFKPATIVDIQRRVQARDFDPATRLYAVEAGEVVGYCTYQTNGRVGYPWCLPGHESAADPLFARTLDAMKQRGIGRAFSCYRKDWPTINEYFHKNGFHLAREMVNYILSFENMPTSSTRVSFQVAQAQAEDFPGIFALDPSVFRVQSPDALKEALWNNAWFRPESLFVLRNRSDGVVSAAGVFITDTSYADPRAVDSSMPCFRLGAFGTEGMTAKRIKGMFSFVTRPDKNLFPVGMEMLSYAATRLHEEDDIWCYAAQVATDAPGLFAFYERTFERQGSFPVYEREL